MASVASGITLAETSQVTWDLDSRRAVAGTDSHNSPKFRKRYHAGSLIEDSTQFFQKLSQNSLKVASAQTLLDPGLDWEPMLAIAQTSNFFFEMALPVNPDASEVELAKVLFPQVGNCAKTASR